MLTMLMLAPLARPKCDPVTDPAGCPADRDTGGAFAPPDVVGSLTGDALKSVADSIQHAVSWVVSRTVAWWVTGSSPDLTREPVIGFIQTWTMPISVTVAIAAILVSAGKIMLTRKADPLINVGTGLVAIAATVGGSAAFGTVLANLLLQWGDAWCNWVLPLSTGNDFAHRMILTFGLPGVPSGVGLILGIIALLIAMIQAVLLLFRQAALLILAGLLPLAAAGALMAGTRLWFKKVSGWMLALIFYKPCAAMVYATAFTLIGTGRDLRAILMGFAMMVISLIAFPALMKFFTWTTGGTDSSPGGGFLGAIIGGATAIGALRSYGTGSGSPGGSLASEHASYLNQQLGHQDPSSGEPQGHSQQPPTGGNGDPGGQSVSGGAQADPPDEPGSGVTGQQQAGDPGVPSGGQPTGQFPGARFGGNPQPPQGPGDEPVGPSTVQAAHHESKRGPETVRWLNNPSGSADGGGDGLPSGSGGGGGGGA
ncbi:hypothetical protein ACRYCC_27185 [Actinomadura scrupuli]|uniref:hypothetical protein n=1 Tax=Actinomadura scrupuli TaxID=559629 RepID=UPI003D99D8EF